MLSCSSCKTENLDCQSVTKCISCDYYICDQSSACINKIFPCLVCHQFVCESCADADNICTLCVEQNRKPKHVQCSNCFSFSDSEGWQDRQLYFTDCVLCTSVICGNTSNTLCAGYECTKCKMFVCRKCCDSRKVCFKCNGLKESEEKEEPLLQCISCLKSNHEHKIIVIDCRKCKNSFCPDCFPNRSNICLHCENGFLVKYKGSLSELPRDSTAVKIVHDLVKDFRHKLLKMGEKAHIFTSIKKLDLRIELYGNLKSEKFIAKMGPSSHMKISHIEIQFSHTKLMKLITDFEVNERIAALEKTNYRNRKSTRNFEKATTSIRLNNYRPTYVYQAKELTSPVSVPMR